QSNGSRHVDLHHKDFEKWNSYPSNLLFCAPSHHQKLHSTAKGTPHDRNMATMVGNILEVFTREGLAKTEGNYQQVRLRFSVRYPTYKRFCQFSPDLAKDFTPTPRSTDTKLVKQLKTTVKRVKKFMDEHGLSYSRRNLRICMWYLYPKNYSPSLELLLRIV